jgi:hypothetical protein
VTVATSAGWVGGSEAILKRESESGRGPESGGVRLGEGLAGNDRDWQKWGH